MKTLSQALRDAFRWSSAFDDAADAADAADILEARVAELEARCPRCGFAHNVCMCMERIRALEATVKELNNQILVLENWPQKREESHDDRMESAAKFMESLGDEYERKPPAAPEEEECGFPRCFHPTSPLSYIHHHADSCRGVTHAPERACHPLQPAAPASIDGPNPTRTPAASEREHDEDCPCYGDKTPHADDCSNCECEKPQPAPPNGAPAELGTPKEARRWVIHIHNGEAHLTWSQSCSRKAEEHGGELVYVIEFTPAVQAALDMWDKPKEVQEAPALYDRFEGGREIFLHRNSDGERWEQCHYVIHPEQCDHAQRVKAILIAPEKGKS